METRTNTTAEQTMADAKGTDYVAAWPAGIARRHRVGTCYVVEAINTVCGTDLPGHLPADERTLDIVADFTPATAKAVVAEVAAIRQRLNDARRNQCPTCGQDTGGRPCRECQ